MPVCEACVQNKLNCADIFKTDSTDFDQIMCTNCKDEWSNLACKSKTNYFPPPPLWRNYLHTFSYRRSEIMSLMYIHTLNFIKIGPPVWRVVYCANIIPNPFFFFFLHRWSLKTDLSNRKHDVEFLIQLYTYVPCGWWVGGGGNTLRKCAL